MARGAAKTEQIRTTYSASEARQRFSDVFDEALYSGPVIIKKRNRTVAIVPADWLAKFEEMEAMQRHLKASERLKDVDDNGGVDFEKLKKEVGLK